MAFRNRGSRQPDSSMKEKNHLKLNKYGTRAQKNCDICDKAVTFVTRQNINDDDYKQVLCLGIFYAFHV